MLLQSVEGTEGAHAPQLQLVQGQGPREAGEVADPAVVDLHIGEARAAGQGVNVGEGEAVVDPDALQLLMGVQTAEAGEALELVELHLLQLYGAGEAGKVGQRQIAQAHPLQPLAVVETGQIRPAVAPRAGDVQVPQGRWAEGGQVRVAQIVEFQIHAGQGLDAVQEGKVRGGAVVVEGHKLCCALHPRDIVDGAVEDLHQVQLLKA